MSIRERLSSMLESAFSAITPSRMQDADFAEGWPGFPPLNPDSSQEDVIDYLDRCSVAGVVIDAASHVTVTLLDPDKQAWIFRFGRAGLQLERYTYEHGSEGPAPGIDDLSMYTVRAQPDEANQDDVTFYELEGIVGLVIEGRSVEVITPSGRRTP